MMSPAPPSKEMIELGLKPCFLSLEMIFLLTTHLGIHLLVLHLV